MMLPCIANLTRYLEREWSEDDDFPWNKLTCLAVVCYVTKKKNGPSSTISSLETSAEQYLNEVDVGVMKSRMQTFSQLFVDSFIPEAQIHFTVPDLFDLDRNLQTQRNEILAAFLDFLVQILHREANVGSVCKQRYAPLQKALPFILAVLGDKPFDCNTQHRVLKEQLKDLLVESEVLANEAGLFIYSCVFCILPVKDDTFYAERNALLKKFEILNDKIKQHCINFSELPSHAVPRSNVVDSFFIINSLVDDLDHFTSPEYFLVKEQIEMLHGELITAQSILKFIEARQDDSATKEPLVQIRDLAYEAEYLISSHVAGNIHSWYLDLRLPSITQDIKLSCERLQQIKEMRPSEVIMHGGEISNATPPPAVDDNLFVELQDNTTEGILSDLVGKPKSPRQIISIFGMPGLGKTTIANKLYRCSSVSHYFDRQAWCVVSQTYNVRSLLINILTHIARELKKDAILKRSDAELGVDIHKSLMKRRYLIVLDDVWHSNAWYTLQRYLPDDGNGSRIILTSRIKDAAPCGSVYHTLPLFSEDQCWDLLEKKMFRGGSCPPELLSIGKGIAAKCSGIPLAVIVTAGILGSLKEEGDAWERVEKKLDAFLLDGLSDYRKILELSYEHLPHYMKPCFLYFAAFPEDVEISVNKLAWRWMAEGFIRKNEGKSGEQVAEAYFLELMNRSLVIPGKRKADGGTKTCRIHDLLRDICVAKANEENFLNSNNEVAIYDKHQRSYISSMSNTDSRPFGLHCRSIIGGLPDRSSCFQTRALLKVLDTRPNKFQKYEGTSFDLPIQLRYLGVNHLTKIMVAKLDHLEFINVVNSSQIKLPWIVLRMKKLKHLLIKKEAIFEDEGYISETTSLITLLYVSINKKSDEAILRDSRHLQTLKCKVGGKTIFPDLSFLKKLETLKMVFEEVGIVRGSKVSNLNFPSTIKNLCLIYTYLPFRKMSVLGRLPNLCVLKLECFAFTGSKWETLDDEFGELRFLKIEQIGLKEWMTCSEHFPKLEQLVLETLWNLVEIPLDLGNISTLQRIEVTHCQIRLGLSALKIEQEQRDYGNEELRVNITAYYWTKEELIALFREKMEHAENSLVMESESTDMYEISSIICSPGRDFLVRNNGEQVKVNSLKGKVVGIYFSASELESCQLFTRKLVKLYNKMKKYGHFEIVYVSSDKDVESFMANFSKLPWLAIPLDDSNTRNKLDELFHVKRLPHLVILDESRKVLTEGVEIVERVSEMEFIPKIKQSEEKGDEDKWNDSFKSLLVSKTRDYVIDNNGTKIPVSNLVGKTTMLFFADDWSPACKCFVPELVKAYQEINEKNDNSVEVIYISYSEDQFKFDEFFATMPWLALPFGDDREKTLTRLYKIKTIPAVVIIGPKGNSVTDDGMKLVRCYGAEAYPFTSERVKDIESENERMAKLWPNKINTEVHDHELGLIKQKDCYRCDGCDELGCDWSYNCADCDFDLHPVCALGNDYKESWPKKVMKEEEAGRNDSLESLLITKSQDFVINSSGEKIPVSNLVGKTTMLFFGAHWCPPCQFVLPKLVQKYEENNEKHNNFVEVIFMSSDEDQFAFDKFFAMMPWLALPFGDDRIEFLSQFFKVKAIPMLVTLEPTGTAVASKGWELISYPGAEAYPFTYE